MLFPGKGVLQVAIRMVGLDLDGTLFNSKKELTAHTCARPGGSRAERRRGGAGHGAAPDRAAAGAAGHSRAFATLW